MVAMSESPLLQNQSTELKEPKLPLRLLLVEDVDFIRMGVKAMLEKHPKDFLIIGEATDGQEAVDFIQGRRELGDLPDVILMDLGLPKISGIDATRQIKARYPNMPVLVFTSNDEEQTVLAALGAGANAYCLKNIAANDLIEAIHYAARGVMWLAPSVAQVALRIFSGPSAGKDLVDSRTSPPNYQLTEREREVLKLMVDGNSNVDIGKELWISANTAKAHVASIMQKLLVNDRVQAAVKAVREDLV